MKSRRPGGCERGFLAYINRFANYIAHFSECSEDMSFLKRYMESGHMDGDTTFFCSSPELLKEETAGFDIEVLHNIAVDGPMYSYRQTLDEMTEENFQIFLELHLAHCEDSSLLGCSEHCLLIGKKGND